MLTAAEVEKHRDQRSKLFLMEDREIDHGLRSFSDEYQHYVKQIDTLTACDKNIFSPRCFQLNFKDTQTRSI